MGGRYFMTERQGTTFDKSSACIKTREIHLNCQKSIHAERNYRIKTRGCAVNEVP